MTKYILSTIAGVESIAKKEVEKVGAKIIEVRDRMIEFEGDSKTMIKVNLWSRVGNKVFEVLAEADKIDTFDKLYDLIQTINLKKYFHHSYPIVVKAKSINSKLDSTPAIQKITKKAIVDNITGKSGEKVFENSELEKFEIMVLLIGDKARILLNTTGEALHKREYRQETGEAPLKESLAAALVLLSDWRFKENFYDLFCGSGTIAIEAAMIAKNIAPGLNRYFAFERLLLVDKTLVEKELEDARKKEYSGEYKIIASDIDENIIEIAKQNAKDAGVYDMIDFRVMDFREYISPHPSPLPEGEGIATPLKGTLVSNPPYGVRLKDDNIESLYKQIDKLFRVNPELKGGVITNYLDFDKLINLDNYKKRKLYNGGELCYFYKRK
ncbi:MAG: class I SAM-dependent RNA methyltransferase [Candidatus Gracilibacteria bacterium]|nr:class I SAM-dependent RNA methyltransferase [Candidatus Gracilibacteria bacterium]